jgi:hypothetical protein
VADGLFATHPRARWRGSRALVALPRDRCPVDQLPLVVELYGQPALFRHGGYGATVLSTVRRCIGCGWRLVAQTQETRP